MNNLEGQLRLEAGDPSGAVASLAAARDAAPGEEVISLNLSESLARSGRGAEALEEINRYVKEGGESARTANQRGNIFVLTGDIPAAVREFENAIRLDPENPAYKENCAAACIELDMVHRAEELLAQVEPEHPSASVYNLLGQVAALKGERARAELAYGAGLERDPGNPDISVNLALLHRERGKHDAARDLLLSVLASHPDHARARALLDRIRGEREEKIACATCGREWWVPRDAAAAAAHPRARRAAGRGAGRPLPGMQEGLLRGLRRRARAGDALLLPRRRRVPPALRRLAALALCARHRQRLSLPPRTVRLTKVFASLVWGEP